MRLPSLLVLLCLSACSWVIDPENQPTRCEIGSDERDPCGQGFACVKGACIEKCVLTAGEPDPCAEGQQCVGGICTAACSDTEICNDGNDNDCDGATDEQDPERKDICGDLRDNDCDGQIDEGHDYDGDGETWCGDGSIPMNEPDPMRDCDDQDPRRFNGATETCDGIDNDCDGTTDEANKGQSLCKGNEQCLGQRCVVPSCAVPEAAEQACDADEMCNVEMGTCGPRLCDETVCNQPGEYCDQTTGECRTTRKANGEACAVNSDCKSLSCIQSEALRLTVASSRVCMQTCCADSDCAEDERCFASGTGARSCLPAALVPPAVGAPNVCSADSQCAPNQSCAVLFGQSVNGSIVEPRNDLVTNACRNLASGDRDAGEVCGVQGAECASRACVLAYVDFFSARFVCSSSCRTSDDCGDVADSASNVNNRPSYCRFVTPNNMAGGDYVPVCVIAGNEVGTGNPGTRCSSGSACKDGACVGATPNSLGICAPTCCNDSQCGSVGEQRTFCRPVPFGGDHYETRCVP